MSGSQHSTREIPDVQLGGEPLKGGNLGQEGIGDSKRLEWLGYKEGREEIVLARRGKNHAWG